MTNDKMISAMPHNKLMVAKNIAAIGYLERWADNIVKKVLIRTKHVPSIAQKYRFIRIRRLCDRDRVSSI